MPLVQIALRSGTSPEHRIAIGDSVHRALVDALGIPADDHFQIITEHGPAGLIYDPQYLGVHRTDRVIFIHITLSAGRKPQQKRKLYKRITELLAASPGVPPNEIVIVLAETAWENWSFGNGEAQYMDA